MDEQKNGEKPRRKRKVLQTLVILLVVIIAGFVAFRLVLKSRLNARLDAIRAEGYPATCGELDAWYTIPESAENAADAFKDAFSHYNKWEEEEKRKLLPVVSEAQLLPLRTEPLTEETKDLITQYVGDNQEALELLHKGAAIEHSRYPMDLSKGFEAVMPDLANIRTGAKLLKLEAALHAENDKPGLATNSIKSMLGLARSLSKEPVLISQILRNECYRLAVSALEHAINRTEFADEQLVELSGTLADGEDLSAMVRAFVGEQCLGVSFFKAPSPQILQLVNGSPSQWGVLRIALYKFTGLADMDTIIYINLVSRYIETTKLTIHEREEAAKAVDTTFYETSRIHKLLHAIMPGFSRVITVDIRTIAQLRTARAGLAIERYRLAKGELPGSLADLVPAYLDAVPKDPFDGEDLRYKKLETGFIIYSIGEDGNDDGGKERQRGKSGRDAPVDVTFIVQR